MKKKRNSWLESAKTIKIRRFSTAGFWSNENERTNERTNERSNGTIIKYTIKKMERSCIWESCKNGFFYIGKCSMVTCLRSVHPNAHEQWKLKEAVRIVYIVYCNRPVL